MTYPADYEAERGLLGVVLRQPGVMEELWGRVEQAWFHHRVHATLWTAFEYLWGEGSGLGLYGTREVWDHFAVRDEFQRRDASKTAADFDELVEGLRLANVVGVESACATLERLAFRRRLIDVGTEYRTLAEDVTLDLDALVTKAESNADVLSVQPSGQGGVWVEEFMATADTDDPWVVPGLLRRGWRAIVVAKEGGGKSTLLRQIAVCAARGVHPLNFSPAPPARVLFVDLENPASALRRAMRQLWGLVHTDVEPAPLRILHRPGGLDLRKPRDRAVVEAEMRQVRPDLLVLGPLYKSYSRAPRETDEEAAMAAQRVLDTLRTRYPCAVLLEHHAPHGDGFKREMRPFGSSAWLRWPELGLGMDRDPERPESVQLKRWRGDRMTNAWPERLDRGQPWPWSGWWPDGMREVAA